MTDTKQALNTPMVRLPRSAQRALHVWEAHRDANTTLDAIGASMAESAERFEGTQSVLNARQAQLGVKRRLLADALRELRNARRGCLALLLRDLSDFDTRGLSEAEVPEDVIADSRAVHERAQTRVQEGEALPFAEQLLGSLAVAIEAAEAAAQAVYEADSLAQQARDARRSAAGNLDDKLIAFRVMLRSVLGSKHRDYRKLRVQATREELEDDPELDPPEAEADELPTQPEAEAEGHPSVALSASNGTG